MQQLFHEPLRPNGRPTTVLPQSMTRRYRHFLRAALCVVLMLAIGLRFVGLGFGHGVLTSRADEELLRSGVLISLTGDLNPHYAVWGHLYHYIYLALAAAWLSIQVAAGWAADWTHAVAGLHSEPWTLIWLGRAISAAAGALTVVATYQLARRTVGSRLVALASSLLLSVLFLHVRDSHFATCDVLLGFCSTAALAALAGRGPLRVGTVAAWTGLALASKLLAAAVVLTVLPVIFFRHQGDASSIGWMKRTGSALCFLSLTAATALVTQPFLLLDPMETWFGLFGDLFNPERVPFEHGLSLTNASILVRYYIPQAMGWLIGAGAILGGLRLLRRPRLKQQGVLLLYTLWFGVAILSVQRTFLRYLVPLLPVVCILCAYGLDWVTRLLARHRRGAVRLATATAATVIVALPNLLRDLALDHRLLRTDTRSLAGDWIERNVPSGSRILWSGYGSISGHLTMPWLHTPVEYDEAHAALRASRGLDTAVDHAIIEWKQTRGLRTYWMARLAFGDRPALESGFDAYPMLDYEYDYPWLKWLDRRLREAGIVRRESPRWDLMRRHVTRALEADAGRPWTDSTSDEIAEWKAADIVVLTGMPVSEQLVTLIGKSFDEVQMFDPGTPWAEYGKRVMYDAGDAWYLPNYGISRVERAGPQIRIFKRR